MELSYKELNEIIIRKTDPMKILLFGINIILLQFLQKQSFFFAKKGSFVSPNLTGFLKAHFPEYYIFNWISLVKILGCICAIHTKFSEMLKWLFHQATQRDLWPALYTCIFAVIFMQDIFCDFKRLHKQSWNMNWPRDAQIFIFIYQFGFWSGSLHQQGWLYILCTLLFL